MEPRKLRPVTSADHSLDQVVRLEDFRSRHPKVEISSPRENGPRVWVATWDDAEDGSTTITRTELRRLLDVLEERFG